MYMLFNGKYINLLHYAVTLSHNVDMVPSRLGQCFTARMKLSVQPRNIRAAAEEDFNAKARGAIAGNSTHCSKLNNAHQTQLNTLIALGLDVAVLV